MTSASRFGSISRRRAALGVVALAFTSVLVTACGGTSTPAASAPSVEVDADLAALVPSKIADNGSLKLGALWETPPMIAIDTSDTSVPVGIAPDLAVIAAGTLGLTPQWQNMQWPAQLPGVLSGQVDALWGQVTGTAEREQAEYDQIPYFKTTDALLVLADDGKDVTRLADMCGKTIATAVGSIYLPLIATVSDEDCVGAGKPVIETAEYQGATAAISAVKAGTVDAWIDSNLNQLQAAKASNGTFTSVEIPADESPANYTSITVSKELPGLSEALAGALRKSVEDGSYQKVLDAYDVGVAALTADEIVVNPFTGLAAGERK